MASRSGTRSRTSPTAVTSVLRHGGDQAILDVGPLCPPHLPPHAHADALSFVLWADAMPLVSDPGSFTYAGPEREAFRSTAAHATLEVDGANQCDFWGAFRAAHLPRVRRLRLEHSPEATVVTAEHDGFRRLADPVMHRRTFCWLPGWGIVVADRLVCRARARCPRETAARSRRSGRGRQARVDGRPGARCGAAAACRGRPLLAVSGHGSCEHGDRTPLSGSPRRDVRLGTVTPRRRGRDGGRTPSRHR